MASPLNLGTRKAPYRVFFFENMVIFNMAGFEAPPVEISTNGCLQWVQLLKIDKKGPEWRLKRRFDFVETPLDY